MKAANWEFPLRWWEDRATERLDHVSYMSSAYELVVGVEREQLRKVSVKRWNVLRAYAPESADFKDITSDNEVVVVGFALGEQQASFHETKLLNIRIGREARNEMTLRFASSTPHFCRSVGLDSKEDMSWSYWVLRDMTRNA